MEQRRLRVAVIKKNASILSKFNKWFDSPEFDKDLPVLIIDDESDYASVNSAKLDDSPTRINSLIRDLCQISSRTLRCRYGNAFCEYLHRRCG